MKMNEEARRRQLPGNISCAGINLFPLIYEIMQGNAVRVSDHRMNGSFIQIKSRNYSGK